MNNKENQLLDSFQREFDAVKDILPKDSYSKLHSLLSELSHKLSTKSEEIAQLQKRVDSAEKRLEKYTNIFEINPSIMTITTLEEGKYLEVNEAFTKATGYTSEEVIGKTVYDIHIWKEEGFRTAFVKQVKEKGRVKGMQGQFIRKDGSYGHTRISAEIAELDGIACLVASFEDMSEQEMAKEKFQSLFHLSPDALIIHRFGKDILEANQAAFNMFGYTRDELIRRNMFDLQRNATREQMNELMKRLKSNGYIKVENELITRFNKSIPVIIHAKTIDYEGEQVVLAQVHDISFRLEAERKTRESEELLRTLINATPDIVCFKDGEGKWMEVNQAYLKLFGLENVDYRGKTDLELSECALPNFKKAFDTCKISDEETWKAQKIKHFDEILSDRHGNKHTYDIIKVPLLYANGERKGMVVLGRNITARKKVEEQLRESEEKSSSILAALPDLIFEFNRHGDFVNAFAHNTEELAIPKESFIGKNIKDVFSSTYAAKTLTNIQNTLKRNTVQIYQYEISVKGQLKHYEARMVPKGANHTLAIVRDITGQKQSLETIARHKTQLEKQNREYERINQKLQNTIEELQLAKDKAEESNRLKSAFLATMSHELRTPLNSIIGFSEMLSEEVSLEEVEEYGTIVHRSGKHLLGLVEEIFDLSLIESGQARVHKENFYLKDILEETHALAKDYRKKIGKNNISLLSDFNTECIESTIFSDAVKIKQVMLNLIKNAIKFTEDGSVTFGCYQEVRGQHSGITLYVKDTGIGIPKHKQEDIFEIFQQVDNSDTRKYGGSGIGLSVAKKITSLLSGTLKLDSQLGIGTTFEVWLPLGQATDNNQDATSNQSVLPNWKDKNILIAEDDPDSADLLSVLLKETRARLIYAKDGMEAVEQCPFADLILMDLQMPVMGGLEATKKIKQSNPELPIIALTARALKGDRDEALNGGCDDYLSKPFKRNELIKLLTKHL